MPTTCYAIILYLNIIIIVYAEVVKARQEERHNADLRQQQLELQLSYYDSLWKEQEQTRAMWHDMSKYLTAMKAVSVSGDKSSVEQVFLDAQDSLSKIGSVVDVGNPEVGAILQHYAQQANDLTVPLDLSVWVQLVKMFYDKEKIEKNIEKTTIKIQ